MSLVKQLWMATVVMALLSLAGSFAISAYTACNYFEEQLRLKNIDSANSLALILSQVKKEPALLEVLISSQFDTGHYQRIELVDPRGKPLVRKIRKEPENRRIPAWFRRVVSLKVEPGIAQIQDNWKQFGTLYVESVRSFAQTALWKTSLRLLGLFSALAIMVGLIGTVLVRMITRPLDKVVAQAEAFAQRRFIVSKVPRTLEFAKVVQAMNMLADRLRSTLEAEGRRLEELRKKARTDQITGLDNRDHFMAVLHGILDDDDRSRVHALFILRLPDLQGINAKLGHLDTDVLLRRLGRLLIGIGKVWRAADREVHLARLNGSDFALVVEDIAEIGNLAADLEDRLATFIQSCDPRLHLVLPLAGGTFRPGEDISTVLSRVDSLLAAAEQRYESKCITALESSVQAPLFTRTCQWREALEEALKVGQVCCQYFPVLNMKHELMHEEAMMRVILDGKRYSAASILPWAKRVGVLPLMDLEVVKRVMVELAKHPSRRITINLAIDTLKSSEAVLQLEKVLAESPAETKRLGIEVAERPALAHLSLFLNFCKTISPSGCILGLDRAGSGFPSAAKLQEVGLDYLKIDRTLVHDLPRNVENQNFLRGMAILAHSIGIRIIAEGVELQDQVETLMELGIDGITGKLASFKVQIAHE